jgi:hypothetical protein
MVQPVPSVFRPFVCLLAAVVFASVAAPAAAQMQPPRQRPDRPTRGIFAAGLSEWEQSLIFNASFGAGYDDDLLAETLGGTLPPSPNQRPRSGKFGVGSLGLDYSLKRDRVSAGANASLTSRYYPDLEDSSIVTYAAGVQASVQLARRTSLSTSHQLGILPNHLRIFYGFGFDPRTEPEPADDLSLAVGRETYLDLRSSVGLTQEVTDRLALSAGYSYYAADLRNDQETYSGQSISAGGNYRIARGLGARLMYGYSETSFGDDPANRHKGSTIDGGIDFNRALSLTRRTSLTFGTGVSGIRVADDTRYFATGNVQLSREMGRSWTASVGAARSVSFFQTFGEPVLSDTVHGGISGLLSRRLSFSASTGWAQGNVGVVSGADFQSTHAGAGLRWGIARMLGLSLRYSIYRYDFAGDGPLPAGIEREMKRQSVRVSLDFWAPLLTQERSANASR